MPIYAKCTFGPLDQPNYTGFVEIVTQIPDAPFGRFRVRHLKTNYVFDCWSTHLLLCWYEPPVFKEEGKEV
jgi:hypothetical protein